MITESSSSMTIQEQEHLLRERVATLRRDLDSYRQQEQERLARHHRIREHQKQGRRVGDRRVQDRRRAQDQPSSVPLVPLNEAERQLLMQDALAVLEMVLLLTPQEGK